MCAKNYLLIFSNFLDIWENVEWPRFWDHPVLSNQLRGLILSPCLSQWGGGNTKMKRSNQCNFTLLQSAKIAPMQNAPKRAIFHSEVKHSTLGAFGALILVHGPSAMPSQNDIPLDPRTATVHRTYF